MIRYPCYIEESATRGIQVLYVGQTGYQVAVKGKRARDVAYTAHSRYESSCHRKISLLTIKWQLWSSQSGGKCVGRIHVRHLTPGLSRANVGHRWILWAPLNGSALGFLGVATRNSRHQTQSWPSAKGVLCGGVLGRCRDGCRHRQKSHARPMSRFGCAFRQRRKIHVIRHIVGPKHRPFQLATSSKRRGIPRDKAKATVNSCLLDSTNVNSTIEIIRSTPVSMCISLSVG